jgi:hypothetical protein
MDSHLRQQHLLSGTLLRCMGRCAVGSGLKIRIVHRRILSINQLVVCSILGYFRLLRRRKKAA